MPLSAGQPVMETQLKALFKNRDLTEAQFATELATIIHTYVSTATVTTAVTGTCPAGPVVGTGNGALS